MFDVEDRGFGAKPHTGKAFALCMLLRKIRRPQQRKTWRVTWGGFQSARSPENIREPGSRYFGTMRYG
jgi:hypothetical protein